MKYEAHSCILENTKTQTKRGKKRLKTNIIGKMLKEQSRAHVNVIRYVCAKNNLFKPSVPQ